MLQLVFYIPLIVGIAVFFLPAKAGRLALFSTAVIHAVFTALEWFKISGPLHTKYFSNSPEGMLVLGILSFLFLFISLYTVFYMDEVEMSKEPVFNGSMLLFLAAMSMVAIADHIIMLWVAVEATTLMSAPLIFVHRSKESLEATWKYVLICSVGIALALLGCFFVIFSMEMSNVHVPITFSSLTTVASQLDPIWLKAGFIFIVIGFGTKMGLAPMHTWLPDAHSEAPSPASALLSGALLNCAFLAVYRCHQLMYAAGLGEYSSNVLIAFGLASMLVSAVFILNQTDYKRMLAYSSIENMGIIAVGIGIGGLAAFGAMLHMIHHSLVKSSLFLSAGNILLGYGTKAIDKTGGMLRLIPKTGVTFFAGFAGISGFPPFGLFVSELLIILGAIKAGRYVAIGIFIFSLILIFAGASKLVMKMVFSEKENDDVLVPEKWTRALPPIILLLTSLALVIWLPDSIYQTIQNAISSIGGTVNG
ncbi:MAG: hydrogenase [Proteobacteria bacterium]|nr:hydrogenase [Pseudomonadota bacterium]MBU1233892.1 hydrogenase [Pseudomonadota bacterium]MBU1418208.1 hydrogenase [Pseudomonadota bacterium]MBU1455274.1 hydrogenase [Pseudomonadota bacterium]